MPYDDSQPRDKSGMWTSGGSSGGGLPPSAYAAGMAKAPSGTSIKGAHPFNSLSEARKFANTSTGYARVLTRGNETIVALDRKVSTAAILQGFVAATVLGAVPVAGARFGGGRDYIPIGMRSNPKRESRRKSNFRSTLSLYGAAPKI